MQKALLTRHLLQQTSSVGNFEHLLRPIGSNFPVQLVNNEKQQQPVMAYAFEYITGATSLASCNLDVLLANSNFALIELLRKIVQLMQMVHGAQLLHCNFKLNSVMLVRFCLKTKNFNFVSLIFVI